MSLIKSICLAAAVAVACAALSVPSASWAAKPDKTKAAVKSKHHPAPQPTGGPGIDANGMPTFDTEARTAIVIDYNSGATLLDKNADERMPTASMSKIMTAYQVGLDLKAGKAKLDDELPVSEAAWKTGGSKMFVPYPRQREGDRPVARGDDPIGQRCVRGAGRGPGRQHRGLRRSDEPDGEKTRLDQQPFRRCRWLARPQPLHDAARPGDVVGASDPRFPRPLQARVGEGVHLQQHQAGQPQPAALPQHRRGRREDWAHRRGRLWPGRVGAAQRPPHHHRGFGLAEHQERATRNPNG